MASSFLEGLMGGLESSLERRAKRREKERISPLDLLELQFKQKQMELGEQQKAIQAENLKALISQRQREQEIFPETDPFSKKFPELLGKTRGEALGLIPSLLSQSERQAAREKPRPLSHFESQQVISLAGSGRRLNKISKDLVDVNNQIGPLNPKGRSQLFLQLSKDPKFAIFKKDVLQEFNEYRKRITGAQAVFKEIRFLQEASLNSTDPPEIFLPKLQDFIDEAEFNRENLVDILSSQNKPVPKSIRSSFKYDSGVTGLFNKQPSQEEIVAELRRRGR